MNAYNLVLLREYSVELVLYAYSSNMHKYFSATPRIMHTVVHHDVYELVSAIV